MSVVIIKRRVSASINVVGVGVPVMCCAGEYKWRYQYPAPGLIAIEDSV